MYISIRTITLCILNKYIVNIFGINIGLTVNIMILLFNILFDILTVDNFY